jgi:hypothetical protein
MNISRIPKSYKNLYEKYASLIYGNICQVVEDKKTVDKIFIEIFPAMVREKIIEAGKPLNIAILLRFIYSFTTEIKRKNKPVLNSLEEKIPLMRLACRDCSSLEQVGHKTGIANHDVAKKLHLEFASFKNELSIV